MNFAQMLAMDVKPLPDTRERGDKKWQRATDAMHEAKHSKAVDKYCDAIGEEWVKTADVADRLGMERTSIFTRLTEYHKKGILDRRPLGGKPYNHHTGWEWRVSVKGE
jgi:predicted Rossmann fold nucleotide-binding protein DprA/Smf involved in DNA uptake